MNSKQPSKGFALLITITLLAFLVLLLVSLASLTRVETQVADNNQKLSGARANAVLALNLALGQLQKFAGPDQRVTARADLTAGVANPSYTGVWDATAATPSATAPAVWLVSGNESSPVANTPATDISGNADSILLVDKSVNGTPTLQVRVLKQAISSSVVPGLSGPQPIGHYAYWVGDEGVKARANLVSPWPLAASTPAQRNVESGYNFATAQRTGIEQLAREANPPAAAGTAIGVNAYVPNDVSLKTVLSPEQLSLAIPAAVSSAESTAVRDAYRYRFHDLTTRSVSVLADPRSGGLKKDLSRWLETGGASHAGAPADNAHIFGSATTGTYYLDPPTWGLLRSFANTKSDGDVIGPQIPSATSQGISPVLACIEVGFAPGLDPTHTRPRMAYFPRVLLWNPYNVPLNTGDLEIGWSGPTSPNPTIQLTARGTGTGTAFYVCQNNLFGPNAGAGSVNFLRFRIAPTTLAAGASTLFTLNAGGAYDSGGNNLLVAADNPHSVYYENPAASVAFSTDPTLGPDEKISITYTQPASGGDGVISAYLRAWSPGQAAITAPSANTYQFTSRAGVGASAPGALVITEPDLTPWFRAFSYARLPAANTSLPTRWITNGNIRAALVDRSGVDAGNPLYTATLAPGSTPSVDASTVVNHAYVNGGSAGDALVLFQVPRADTPLFSIADLRHANLAPLATAPAYPVATSAQDFRIARTAAQSLSTPSYPLYDYAYLLNQALWDRHFFSTVPAGLPAGYATDPAYASLPNGRHHYYLRNGAYPARTALLDPSAAAANLVLQGGFNVNSTSVQAWRAQLAALNAATFDPVTGAENTATVLNRAFSRFIRPPAASTNVWRGFRELTESQLNALAEAIVTEVRSRGPFLSVGQFVNRDLTNDDKGLKGPLQAAIDTVDLAATHRINTATPLTQDLVGTMSSPPSGYDLAAMRGMTAAAAAPVASRNTGAPGTLTQADILAALGATLTARSDTFVVRAYGDVMNPATGATTPDARAWCEAVVQRLPDYVNSTADSPEVYPPTNSDNLTHGRRFRLVSFRWLSADDI
jgi:hypothetical protein